MNDEYLLFNHVIDNQRRRHYSDDQLDAVHMIEMDYWGWLVCDWLGWAKSRKKGKTLFSASVPLGLCKPSCSYADPRLQTPSADSSKYPGFPTLAYAQYSLILSASQTPSDRSIWAQKLESFSSPAIRHPIHRFSCSHDDQWDFSLWACQTTNSRPRYYPFQWRRRGRRFRTCSDLC